MFFSSIGREGNISLLIPFILTAASLSEGEEAEARKHRANDPKCSEMGWVCIPLAVETYGNWGREAQSTFSCLASHLAITKGKVLTELYSRQNFTQVRAVARVLLVRCAPSLGLLDIPCTFLCIVQYISIIICSNIKISCIIYTCMIIENKFE